MTILIFENDTVTNAVRLINAWEKYNQNLKFSKCKPIVMDQSVVPIRFQKCHCAAFTTKHFKKLMKYFFCLHAHAHFLIRFFTLVLEIQDA